jgi:very-short-patch-repair endonuclease
MARLYRSSDLAAAGVSDATRRSRAWVRLRRGVYCPADEYAGSEEHRFRLAVRAALAVAPPGAHASHTTAARLWRLARSGLHPDDGLLHLSGPARVSLAGCVTHVAELGLTPLRPGGMRATGLARTVVDCARVLPMREAVVVADSALLAYPGLDLAPALLATAGLAGAPAAQRVVAFADGRAESVLESLARVLWHEGGLPAPQLQRVFRLPMMGRCRVDFCWEAARLVVEVDGLGKYDEPGALQREKQRQNALVAAGCTVLRFTWADVVARPGPTVAMVADALA